MSDWLPNQESIGKTFSIIGLIVVPFCTLFRNTYSNFFDSLQLCYIMVGVLAPNLNMFSSKLGDSWLEFMPNFLKYCEKGDFSCTYGHLLSPLIAWIVACLFCMAVIRIIKHKWENVWFKPFYQFYKGLLRWILGPLTYACIVTIITEIQGQLIKSKFYAAIGTLVVICLIIMVEMLYFTCIQQQGENTHAKWVNLMNHIRIGTLMILLALQNNIAQGPKYSIFAVIVAYDLYFLFGHKFIKPVLERILVALSELSLVAICILFLWSPQTIFDYNLDFFALLFILAIELSLLIFRIHYEVSDQPMNEAAFIKKIQNEHRQKMLHRMRQKGVNMNFSMQNPPNKGMRKGNQTSHKNSQKDNGIQRALSGEVGLTSLESMQGLNMIDEDLNVYYKNTRRRGPR